MGSTLSLYPAGNNIDPLIQSGVVPAAIASGEIHRCHLYTPEYLDSKVRAALQAIMDSVRAAFHAPYALKTATHRRKTQAAAIPETPAKTGQNLGVVINAVKPLDPKPKGQSPVGISWRTRQESRDLITSGKHKAVLHLSPNSGIPVVTSENLDQLQLDRDHAIYHPPTPVVARISQVVYEITEALDQLGFPAQQFINSISFTANPYTAPNSSAKRNPEQHTAHPAPIRALYHLFPHITSKLEGDLNAINLDTFLKVQITINFLTERERAWLSNSSLLSDGSKSEQYHVNLERAEARRRLLTALPEALKELLQGPDKELQLEGNQLIITTYVLNTREQVENMIISTHQMLVKRLSRPRLAA